MYKQILLSEKHWETHFKMSPTEIVTSIKKLKCGKEDVFKSSLKCFAIYNYTSVMLKGPL